ncbi:hypothetical protein PF002_g2966 [Phytophthora fragariae]|uniref:Calponin-homology (CH) domain-containing protein n=1 Tax=Phytophthora fragariae TaxID=53985 RepID=A0A6A3IFG6_9STRA|nr:hypothetical protein PF011_g22962 [Phytophthora fragariae]KAE9186755.1 hypothetical protein PF004_g22997 [Phytophthora fragariae]KAE9254208.1 hypothetical protein PF002_g2966 [Phytophthora fragariae]KAE9341522.1 hypothetical protein PF008_g10583 [Phytophthora fragariae]
MERSASSLSPLPSTSRSPLLPVSIKKSTLTRTPLPSSPSGNQQSHKRPIKLVTSSAAASQRSPLAIDTRISPSSNDNGRRKTRPTTAAVGLSSTETINAMIGIPEDVERVQQHTRPESAQPIVGRRPSFTGSIAPLGSTHSPSSLAGGHHHSAWSIAPTSSVVVSSSRCAGCGGYAEMCLSCFTQFKQKDGARYKTQLVQAVDSLFEKATTRAFTRMAAVVLQWVFQAWRAAARRSKWKHRLAERLLQKSRMRRLWKTWQVFLYERRIVGAMLYAESQQRETHEKAREVAKLHGDGFERESAARVHEALHRDAVNKLEAQLAALKTSSLAKDRELLELRKELREKHALVDSLQTQVIDPREIERMRVESSEYKKASFQLVGALTHTMEAQVEVLSTSEGRQNLSEIFTRDLLHSIDKPENAAFYNPLVDMETAASASTASAEVASNNFMLAYEAPVDRADVILTQWVNSLIARQPHDWLAAPRMQNFHSSLNDGKIFAVITKLLHAAMCRTRLRRPPGATVSRLEATSVLRENGEDLTEIAMERYLEHVRRETSVEKRLELMINTLGQAMWLPLGLLNAKDIRAGHAEFNFAALTYFFVTFSPCLAPDYYSLCAELTQQLEAVKCKWRELQGDSMATAAALAMGSDPTTGEEISMSMRVKLALSQTLELKRRIDSEDVKSREGHSLWVKAERIVMRKCFLSYARLARGKVGVLSKLDSSLGDENEAFAKIPKHKLQDLALPYEDFTWEAKLLQSYLVTIYCDLARIYRGYATRSGVINETINIGEFTELLTECHVLEGNMTAGDLQNIIRAMDPKSKTVNAHRALPPIEFLEALIRVGRKKTNRVTISEAFCLLIDNFILPFAFRSDADLFRHQLDDATIRRLLIKYADDLKTLYDKYAAEDPKHKNKSERVTAFTFSQCLLDRGVLDMTLTSDKVLGILSKVLRTAKAGGPSGPTDSSSSAKGGRRAGEDDDVTYPEFEEALIAVACHKFPDPYTSLESRVEKFFSVYIRERRG